MGRPTKFDVLLRMSKALWGPVYQTLSQEDMRRLRDLPYNEALYQGTADRAIRSVVPKAPRVPPNDELEWITAAQIDKIHDELITAYRGEPGTKHRGVVHGIVERAQHSEVYGVDPFPTLFEKAAHIMREIANQHPYNDGQKRTSIGSAFVFLGMNGFALWSRNFTSEIHYAIKVADGEQSVDQIAEWLRRRVGPLQIGKGDSQLGTLSQIVGLKGSRRLSCQQCRRFVRISGVSYAFCDNCRIAYEITARAAAFVDGPRGHQIQATIGLHKLTDEKAKFREMAARAKRLDRTYLVASRSRQAELEFL